MDEDQKPQIYLERTLAILMPDIVKNEVQIEEILFQNGFTVTQKRHVRLSPEQSAEFYKNKIGLFEFSSLVKYLASGIITVMVIAKENAITIWREIVEAISENIYEDKITKSLRSVCGTDKNKNALHASVTFAAAESEIRYFFPDTVVEPIPVREVAKDYLASYVNPTLLIGLTEVCKIKPKDPVRWLADWLLANNPNQPTVNELCPKVDQLPCGVNPNCPSMNKCCPEVRQPTMDQHPPTHDQPCPRSYENAYKDL